VLFTLRQLLDHSDDLHHLHSHLPPLLRDDQLMLLGLPCWRVRFQLLGMLDLQHQLRHLFGLKHDLPDLCLWHATVQQRLLQLMPGWHVQLVLHPVLGLHVSLLQLYIWVQHCLHRLRLEPALALWFHLLRVVPHWLLQQQLHPVHDLQRQLRDLLWIGHNVPDLQQRDVPLWHHVRVCLPGGLLHLGHVLCPVLFRLLQLHLFVHDLHQLPVHRIDIPLRQHVLCHLPHWYIPLVDVGLLSVYYSLLGMHIGQRLHKLHRGQLPLADQHVCILVPQWLLRQRLQLPLLRLLLFDLQRCRSLLVHVLHWFKFVPLQLDVCVLVPERLLRLWFCLFLVLNVLFFLHRIGHLVHQLPSQPVPLLWSVLQLLPSWHIYLRLDVCGLPVALLDLQHNGDHMHRLPDWVAQWKHLSGHLPAKLL